MPRRLAQCGDRKKEISSRLTRWAACIIATSGWRPENAGFRTGASSRPSSWRRELVLPEASCKLPSTTAAERRSPSQMSRLAPAANLVMLFLPITGIIPEPDGPWMKQVARNLTDGIDGFLSGCRYLIHDRASVFSETFGMILEAAGLESVRLPARSPNLNAIAERFVRSIKESCLDRMNWSNEAPCSSA